MTPALLTHANYVKRLKLLLEGSTLSVKFAQGQRNRIEIRRFKKLHEITVKSIEKDMELVYEDPVFSTIAAPWFPVKCYYALYYLESVLMHLIDGSVDGFGKGGHAGIRRKFARLVGLGTISFSDSRLSSVYNLSAIQALPAIIAGQNTRANFWLTDDCTNSMTRKLMDYKIHDQGKSWNLRTKKDRNEKKQYIIRESLLLTDFFYWYRIKANYRDLDYIDYESGVTADEVLEYMKDYHAAFDRYRELLSASIESRCLIILGARTASPLLE